MKIKNIIFDFGGVFYNVDYFKTIEEFTKLSEYPEALNSLNLNQIMDIHPKFECGLVTPHVFREALRKEHYLNAGDSSIDAAWNAMLLGLKPDAMKVVHEISKYYNITLFSNTNVIHFNYFYEECQNFLPLFKTYFLSYKIGLRKPDFDSYRYVCEKSNFLPENTLFIDDSPRNVDAAIDTGLLGLVFEPHFELSEILDTIEKF